MNIFMWDLPILYQDEILYTILDTCCRFGAKKTQSVGVKISQSLFSSQTTRKTLLDHKAFYKCGQVCKSKMYVLSKMFQSSDGQHTYPIKERIDRSYKFVLHMINCTTCGLSYIGCSIQKWKRNTLLTLVLQRPFRELQGTSRHVTRVIWIVLISVELRWLGSLHVRGIGGKLFLQEKHFGFISLD